MSSRFQIQRFIGSLALLLQLPCHCEAGLASASHALFALVKSVCVCLFVLEGQPLVSLPTLHLLRHSYPHRTAWFQLLLRCCLVPASVALMHVWRCTKFGLLP
jgi:hypothetical protein